MRFRRRQSLVRRLLAGPVRAAAIAVVASSAPPVVDAQPPARDLMILAPAAPGGGWDQTARVMQQVLRDAGLARSVQVVNAAGAAGTIGLARFVTSESGNPDALLVMGLVMVSGIAANRSPVTLADVTPIARLSGEYEVVVVPASSPHRTLADLLTAFRADPRGVSWGGGSAGGTDEVLVRLLADALDVPRDGVNYIAYSGGGQALASVLGAHVTAAVSGLGEFASQIESGALRALAISSPEPVPGVRIPTFRAQGIPLDLLNWRGVVAPPGISRSERRSLEQLVLAMTASPAWKTAVERNGWADISLTGDAFDRFIDAETRRVAPLVAASAPTGAVDWFGTLVLAGLVASLGAAVGLRLAGRGSPPRRPGDGTNHHALALVGVGLALNVALLRPAGFIVAATVMFVCIARAFGSGRPVRDAAVGAVVAGAIFVLFTRALGVALPAGPFG